MKKCHVQKQISKTCACVDKFDSLRLDCQNIIQLITRVSSSYKFACYILENRSIYIISLSF